MYDQNMYVINQYMMRRLSSRAVIRFARCSVLQWFSIAIIAWAQCILGANLRTLLKTRARFQNDAIVAYKAILSVSPDFSIQSDSMNDPAPIGSRSHWSSLQHGSVLDLKFRHKNCLFFTISPYSQPQTTEKRYLKQVLPCVNSF